MSIAIVFLTIVGLFYAYCVSAGFSVLVAFLLQFLFPAVMKIIDIPWPTWVYEHADKFTSWFVVIFTFRLIVGSFIPVNPKIKNKKDAEK
ncbi:hypothetical protein LQZ19_08765 [Treponema primitia]|uniref:hypothetical protein n=1 Tax=Treponema primitia TaxID=88058 RepID=UPI003980A5DD